MFWHDATLLTGRKALAKEIISRPSLEVSGLDVGNIKHFLNKNAAAVNKDGNSAIADWEMDAPRIATNRVAKALNQYAKTKYPALYKTMQENQQQYNQKRVLSVVRALHPSTAVNN